MPGLSDLAQILRPLRKHPVHSLIVFSILAVGVGASSAFYSVSDALLLRPLPFDRAGRLVDVGLRVGANRSVRRNSQQYLSDLRDQSKTLDGVAAYRSAFGTSLTINGRLEQPAGLFVDRHFFRVLGVAPALGRTFTAEDERLGAPCSMVLNHAFWLHHFAGDLSIIGKTVPVDRRLCTVVGVMPKSFSFPFREFQTPGEDFWLAMPDNPATRLACDKYGIARLAPGKSVGEAQVEASRIASQFSDPDLKRGSLFLLLRAYRETLIEDFLPMLVLLGGVLACLLLVVCINVASLLAVEAMRSRKEMAIRFALGGTRWQIVRVFLLRVLALAGAGGVGGIGLAWFLVALICKVLPDGFPSADQIALKSQVLWFSAAVTVGTAIVSGVWPAMAATRSLHQFSGGENAHAVMTSSTARRRGHLVVLQLVFSGAFLVVTGMFGLSLQRLLSVDPGIQTDHRFVVVLRPADSTLKAPALNAFYSGIGSNLVGVPGVKATALSTNVPLGGHGTRDFRIKDRPEPKQPGEWLAEANAVDPNYFRVLGIPMRRGRSFDQQDGIGGRPVAIVNELFAGRFFRGESALGGQICLPSREGCVWREIVGVVADARDGRLDSPPQATCFVPFSQALGELSSAAAFTLQTEVGAAVVRESVQRRIGQLAPGAAIMASFTLDELRSIQTLAPRARLWILGAITVLSLLLTSLGVYGIMAGMVEQRRREIGVRMALGASRQEIAALFIRKMAFRLVPGLLIGMGGGAIAVRYLTTVLFETSPGNPVAYGAAASVLCVVAALATLMPVRRALQANPVDALRAE